ncbi:DNA polymerase III subunit gamma/tau [Pikeienuella piscinae]|uniref:DNA polymerase III subunit gamma/tau n=1 Tax=Pikeienuella piscinae TaxID=2748098 RepID=A0A7M3T6L1_9RHOB|nr:DNA polymerase III subunit gamma/tau [Pikeienuella piscinae]QIE57642.1 DNA polymerase III subunit gamma/tau [Pikeienuella piscinae]
MAEDSPSVDEASPEAEVDSDAAYQVLARKHRPQSFADLIGQEPMVRVLTNAFKHDRIHHAFIMTGVRGVGKTTTARIIAKGLNCIGPDGTGGPTTSPCGVCEPCRQIAESRHVDVQEMDAASRTGVGDIRELIDSVRYRATSARYKVYIIDEVHMLSPSAFNALLKTLEEPPPHVKFIFATTEIRKVPVTVLSRCQRFDLRRIEPELMMAHLEAIAAKEGAKLSREAIALITRAAEGSVRDALSLLDQAIAHGRVEETGADEVRAMLGLADRGRVIDLFETIMRGEAAAALGELSNQYADGADPVAVLRDLAELTHWISVVKINPENADDPTVGADERDRGRALAAALEMRALARMWQMLLKAQEEVGRAPNAMMAAEMAVIRLTHVAELPTPEEIVRKLGDGPSGPPAGPRPVGPGGGGGGARAESRGGAQAAERPTEAPRAAVAAPLIRYESFADVVALIRENRDMKLLTDVEDFVHLVRYAPGRIEFAPAERAPADLAQVLGARLTAWTGARWMVAVTREPGEATISEARRAAERAAVEAVAAHPLVAAALAAFPGARIAAIRDPVQADAAPAPDEDGIDDDEEYGDDWSPVDPFAG